MYTLSSFTAATVSACRIITPSSFSWKNPVPLCDSNVEVPVVGVVRHHFAGRILHKGRDINTMGETIYWRVFLPPGGFLPGKRILNDTGRRTDIIKPGYPGLEVVKPANPGF